MLSSTVTDDAAGGDDRFSRTSALEPETQTLLSAITSPFELDVCLARMPRHVPETKLFASRIPLLPGVVVHELARRAVFSAEIRFESIRTSLRVPPPMASPRVLPRIEFPDTTRLSAELTFMALPVGAPP